MTSGEKEKFGSVIKIDNSEAIASGKVIIPGPLSVGKFTPIEKFPPCEHEGARGPHYWIIREDNGELLMFSEPPSQTPGVSYFGGPTFNWCPGPLCDHKQSGPHIFYQTTLPISQVQPIGEPLWCPGPKRDAGTIPCPQDIQVRTSSETMRCQICGASIRNPTPDAMPKRERRVPMNADEFTAAWNSAGGKSGVRCLILKGGKVLLYATDYAISHVRKEEVGKEAEEWDDITLSRVVGRSLLVHGASIRVEDVEEII